MSALIATPDISVIPREGSSHIILASDGLWDALSNEEAAEYIKEMNEKEKSPLEMTQALIETAQKNIYWKRDNTTVIIAKT